ncbi:MAG: hypothetical protein Q8R16_04555 [bacterium]|nr:hypothetical protein [bacterium]
MATRRRKGTSAPASSFLREDLAAAHRALVSAGLPLVPIVGKPIELLVKCSWHGHRHRLVYIQAIVLSVVNDGDSEKGVTRIRISLDRLEGRVVHELVAGEPSPVRWHLMCEDADGKQHKLPAHLVTNIW